MRAAYHSTTWRTVTLCVAYSCSSCGMVISIRSVDARRDSCASDAVATITPTTTHVSLRRIHRLPTGRTLYALRHLSAVLLSFGFVTPNEGSSFRVTELVVLQQQLDLVSLPPGLRQLRFRDGRQRRTSVDRGLLGVDLLEGGQQVLEERGHLFFLLFGSRRGRDLVAQLFLQPLQVGP